MIWARGQATVILEVQIDGEHRAFSQVKITVTDVCYHHCDEIR